MEENEKRRVIVTETTWNENIWSDTESFDGDYEEEEDEVDPRQGRLLRKSDDDIGASVERVTERLKKEGFTLEDLTAFYLRRYSDNPRYMNGKAAELIETFYKVVDTVDDEYDDECGERLDMMVEDTRRHNRRRNHTSLLEDRHDIENDPFRMLFVESDVTAL
jgi:hypothetical protein